MPVSHVGLTVTHLPTSCSFFLAALQPLGYRFVGQQGSQVGLGINNEADFFITQEIPGIKAGAAHIAFSAPDRIAVRNFYTAALTAGGRPHGSPATRDQDNDVFNAAVLDFDGNSIEVVFRESVDPIDDTASTVGGKSRVLTWRKSVSESLGDGQSVVSAKSATKAAMVPFSRAAQSVVSSARLQSIGAPSLAPSQSISQAPTMIRTISAPSQPQPQTQASKELNPDLIADAGARKIIGTLIGAAAGAAVAYAMVKSERGSARDEAEWIASQRAATLNPLSDKAPSPQPQQQLRPAQYMYTPSEVHRIMQFEQQSRRNYSETESYYNSPHQQRAIEAPPARSAHAPTLVSALQAGATSVRQEQSQSPHRNFSETESRYSTPDSRDRYARAALEAAPVSAKAYLNPTCQSVAQSSPHDEAVDYIPAGSVVAKSHFSINRSVTAPSIVSQTKRSATPSASPSRAPSKSPSKPPSKAPSKSPSKLAADNDAASTTRHSSAPSTHSRSHSHASKAVPADPERRSSAAGSKNGASRAISLISSFVPDFVDPAAPSRRSSTGSKVSTVRAAGGSTAEKAPSLLGSALGRPPAAADADHEGRDSDNDTVAPSDSISNAGSSPSSSRRSRTGGESRSGRSKASRHSSRHSHHSHSSSRLGSRDAGGASFSSTKDKDRRSSAGSRKSSRAGVPDEAAAVLPDAVSEASTAKPGSVRKDSVVSVSSSKSSPSKAGSKRGSRVEV